MESAMSKYGQALREAALRRILPPQSESMSTVARDYGISVQTLANWKKMALSGVLTFDEEEETEKLTSQDKFQIVLETAGLSETEIAEYARKKGVFVEQIQEWRSICLTANDQHAQVTSSLHKIIKGQERKIKELQGDLDKKNKALAEVAALQILEKKASAIWGESKEE
jgi:transposase-like protein